MVSQIPEKKILFVDDQNSVLLGMRRVLHSMRHSWSVEFAHGAREALDLMSAQPFDMIIADMQMPGMSGSELLSVVWHLYPHVVRFALSGYTDKEVVLKAAGLSHQFFAKPCNADLLKSAIIRVFRFRDLLCSEPMQALVSTVEGLPVLPEHREALAIALGDRKSSARDIAAIVEKDVAMAAKVFHLAHWDFFDPRHRVRSLERAVQSLGLDFLRNIVLSTRLFQSYPEDLIETFEIRRLYAHSLAVSSLAAETARTISPEETTAEDARLGGLLHDIGKMVLINGRRDEYEKIWRQHGSTETPLYMLEREVFGVSHAEIGGALMILWGFPEHIVESISLHHKPEKACVAFYDTVMSVHMADGMVRQETEPRRAQEDRRSLYEVAVS